ncbi:MAG TPA: hypothetical protein VGP07_04875 [Polyangia bacterium]
MIFGATVLLVGAGAPAVWAANGPDTTGNSIALQGSDTLEEVTKAILAACPGATGAGITYAGGGSGTGETAMSTNPPTQKEAPMSRFINASTATCAFSSTMEGLVIGLDGLAVVAGTANAGAKCGGALAKDTVSFSVTGSCPGCDTGTSTYTVGGGTAGFAGWKDVLKLVYTGLDHTSSTTPDCASATRKALVGNWGKLFQTGCTSGTCPTGLKHAWRRGDASGTTDVFLAALGSPLKGLASAQIANGKPAKNWFCNAAELNTVNPPPFPNGSGGVDSGATSTGLSFGGASDYVDGDPIRISCDTVVSDDDGNLVSGDQVCNYGGAGAIGTPGTLGLVQVIEVPANLDAAALYTIPACSPGKFGLAAIQGLNPGPLPNYMTPCPNGATSCPCPNGGKLIGTSCWLPYQSLTGGGRNFNCLNEQQFVQGAVKNGTTDGRTYNLFARNTNGTYKLDGFNVPEDPSNFANGNDTDLTQRYITRANYLIHTTLVATGSTGTACQKADSTAQIGCLTQADPCSIGYAGREADTVNANVVALTVNAITDSAANIAKILGPTDPTTYPLSRKLFFNTLQGFQTLQGGELALAKCFGASGSSAANTGTNGIIKTKGFIPMDDPTVISFNPSGKVTCQSAANSICTAGATGDNGSCANIPAGLIQ